MEIPIKPQINSILTIHDLINIVSNKFGKIIAASNKQKDSVKNISYHQFKEDILSIASSLISKKNC
jgi:long-subunit acyl-CoA synthetase (AMP-forming)